MEIIKNNITRLSDHADNGDMWTPIDALKDAIKEFEEGGEFHGVKKVMVLFVDDREEKYETTFRQAGMSSVDCISLCEISKIKFMKNMDFLK